MQHLVADPTRMPASSTVVEDSRHARAAPDNSTEIAP
jgi:hypothetical protein